MTDRKPDRITILSGFFLPFTITSTVFSRSVIMIIPMPAEYLDQLYTEIGLLFLISLFLLILFLFPKVSIYSFIKVHSSMEQDESEYASRNYWAKSIDFVICYCHKADRQYLYTPVLLMELDGSSHFSSAKYGTKTFRRQQENDRFKDSLFSDLDIPLIRFQIPDNHLTRKDLPRLRLLLSKYFPRQSQNK